MAESHAGKLLVASPAITDPNFFRTVVLLCAHDENGAFGLVLNRPIEEAPVIDHLPEWGEHVVSPAVMFKGGPVEPAAGFALGRFTEVPSAAGWSPVVEKVALINLNQRPGDFGRELVECRVYAGYSGWGAGQLEGEIKEGGWFVLAAEERDAFTTDPAALWRDVLARQRGETRLFAHFPLDPRAN